MYTLILDWPAALIHDNSEKISETFARWLRESIENFPHFLNFNSSLCWFCGAVQCYTVLRRSLTESSEERWEVLSEASFHGLLHLGHFGDQLVVEGLGLFRQTCWVVVDGADLFRDRDVLVDG